RLVFECDWLENDLRRRRRHDWGRRSLLWLAHDQVPEHLFGDLQRRLELGDALRIDPEILEDVRALLLVLDLVCQLALAPEVGALRGATRPLDQRVHALDNLLDLVVIQVGTNDVQNFVIPQRGPPSYGFRPRSERGLKPPGRGQKG